MMRLLHGVNSLDNLLLAPFLVKNLNIVKAIWENRAKNKLTVAVSWAKVALEMMKMTVTDLSILVLRPQDVVLTSHLQKVPGTYVILQ